MIWPVDECVHSAFVPSERIDEQLIFIPATCSFRVQHKVGSVSALHAVVGFERKTYFRSVVRYNWVSCEWNCTEVKWNWCSHWSDSLDFVMEKTVKCKWHKIEIVDKIIFINFVVQRIEKNTFTNRIAKQDIDTSAVRLGFIASSLILPPTFKDCRGRGVSIYKITSSWFLSFYFLFLVWLLFFTHRHTLTQTPHKHSIE